MKAYQNSKTVLLFGREFAEGFRDSFRLLINRLQKYGARIYIFEPFEKFIRCSIPDMPVIDGTYSTYEDLRNIGGVMLSIGGDGTFLEAITFVRDLPVPLAGINCGRLGFLADISQEEISSAVDTVMHDSGKKEELTLIRVACDQPLFGDLNFALNEITVHKRDDSSMIRIHASLNGEFLNTYWADGLIVSTPTGSTAYSLSVGGPLVLPGTGNLILSPIAPHNLTVRPLVYNDSMELSLRVESRSGNLLVSADSRSVVIDHSLELHITKAPFRITTIRLREHGFYQTLRSKLMWGADKRN
ncbi:MAG: NAD kinase [Bacteroidota bacterium]